VPVKRFVATGGLPHSNPLLMQICADVLGEAIQIHPSRHGPAVGAAVLGALAAGPRRTGFSSAAGAIRAMAAGAAAGERIVRPRRGAARLFDGVYRRYRSLADAAVSGRI
jgi:L-ribulokinase